MAGGASRNAAASEHVISCATLSGATLRDPASRRVKAMSGRTGALVRASGALAVLLAVAAGCATPVPSVSAAPSASTSATPAPPSSNAPSPSPSTAVAPEVVCDRSAPTSAGTDQFGSPIPVRLTCENAVAAAEAVVGPDPAIAYIEFDFGRWCPSGYFCALSTMNDGHVIFHVKGLRPDILVQVRADEAGKVTAASPQPMPSPSS
jgi:hypothetical protein